MFRSTRHAPRAPRPAVLAALLALTLMLAALVGHEAWRARGAQREATERALADYAIFASTRFAERTAFALRTTIFSVFGLPATPPAALEGADAWRARDTLQARRAATWCGCLDSVRAYFTLQLEGGRLAVQGGSIEPALRAWIQDAVAARAREYAALQALVAGAGGAASMFRPPPAGPQAVLPDIALYFPRIEGRQHAVTFALAADTSGIPRVAYGLVSEPGGFVIPLVQRLLTGIPLLPSTVVRGLPNDSVVVVTLQDAGGRSVLRSAPAAPSRYGLSDYASADTLSRQPGALRFSVALREDVIPRLAVPGPPPYRLAVALALLGTALAVGAVLALQLRRAVELARARTAFVSGISHELRTPLTQIRLFSELLEGRLGSEAERRRWAGIIDREARRLGYMVENVLSFARAGQGGLRVTPVATDVARIVDEVLQGFQPIAAARQATVRAEVAPDAALWVDPVALRHILLNFLDNAVKYGPKGQTVTVRTEPAGAVTRLAVEDQGPGVPPAERERIWQPYYRSDRDAAATGGSGIGLALVHELAALHGGRVWVEAAPGGGARFVAELPAIAPAPEPAAATPPEPAVMNRTDDLA